MLKLKEFNQRIVTGIKQAISAFSQEHKEPKAIGIYSCPSSGWVSINFNKKKNISQVDSNCPDFEFVEFSLIELPEWTAEYESEEIQIKTGFLSKIKISPEDGDESFNKVIFDYLCDLCQPILLPQFSGKVLIQMLDSEYSAIL